MTSFSGHLLTGDHASLPAANTVPDGTLYSCTDHGKVYKADQTGNVWNDWLDASAGVPGAHATSHENGGSDEIDVTDLSGLLADGQTPLAHAASHQNGGADEISVAGLSGLLADNQNPVAHAASHETGGSDPIDLSDQFVPVGGGTFTGDVNVPDEAYDATGWNGSTEVPTKNAIRDKIEAVIVGAPAAHAASHQNGGTDEIDVTGLSGLLGTAQTPTTHATSHQNGGADEISVAGLSGELADPQPPKAHQSSHLSGGSDEILMDITIPFIIDGGGSAITNGIKGDIELPCNGTITAWRLVADQTGDIVVDTWKDTFANFPPTIADTIWGGTEPELAAAIKAEATGLAIAVSVGEWLRFNVSGAATLTRVTLSITIRREL